MKCEVGDAWCSGNCLWCRGMRRERKATRFVMLVAGLVAVGLAVLVMLAHMEALLTP